MSVTPTPPPTKQSPLTTLVSNGFLVSLIAIVGLIVLMALNKVSVAEGLPPVLALAGVHLGASVTS